MDEKQIHKLKAEQKQLKDAPAARRALAVLLFTSGGDVSLSGYTNDHAKRLRRQYLKEGLEAFRDKRTSNRDRILTKAERGSVVEILTKKLPREVVAGCSEERWSTYWLGEYVHATFGKRYKSKTSHYLLFREAKLTWHQPGRSYEKADEAKRRIWEQETRPLLADYWDNPDIVILCEDEMVLTSKTTTQKVWLPQGQYPPVLETNGTRTRKNFYGFLNLKTGDEHAFVTDYQNMYITAEILDKVRALYPKQTLILFWDNCGWHRGSKVTEWIKKDGNTKTVYFPAYTPELNPQEHVWKAGRRAVTHNQYIPSIAEIAGRFAEHITSRTFPYALLGFRAA